MGFRTRVATGTRRHVRTQYCNSGILTSWIDKKMDTDNPEHIQWLYKIALHRAQEFKIEGVTYSLTQGVVKNIIPAIASTNAIIAGMYLRRRCCAISDRALILNLIASCCNEAFKIATSSAAYLNNYFMLIGTDGVYSYTFEHEKRDDCPVCGGESLDITLSKDWTVERLIEILVERQDMYVHSLASNSRHITDLQRPVRSRSRRCPHPGSRSTSRLLHSWKKRRVQTWRRRYQSWSRMAGRSRSPLRLFRSTSLCGSSTLRHPRTPSHARCCCSRALVQSESIHCTIPSSHTHKLRAQYVSGRDSRISCGRRRGSTAARPEAPQKSNAFMGASSSLTSVHEHAVASTSWCPPPYGLAALGYNVCDAMSDAVSSTYPTRRTD